jgi:hypothetical protein
MTPPLDDRMTRSMYALERLRMTPLKKWEMVLAAYEFLYCFARRNGCFLQSHMTVLQAAANRMGSRVLDAWGDWCEPHLKTLGAFRAYITVIQGDQCTMPRFFHAMLIVMGQLDSQRGSDVASCISNCLRNRFSTTADGFSSPC